VNASSLNTVLDNVFMSDFGSATDASVAATVVSNLGLTGTAATEGQAYIVGVLGGTAASAKGAAIMTILNQFAGLTSDATFGAAATAWETKVGNAVNYSQDTANTTNGSISNISSTPPGQTFTLTTSIDTDVAAAGSNNNTFNAGPGTLTALDTLTGVGTGNVLNVTDTAAIAVPTSAAVSGIQTVNFRSALGVSGDVSGWTGLTAANITGSIGTDSLTAAATTNVTVANTGNTSVTSTTMTVSGGNNVTVTETGATTSQYGNVDVEGSSGTVTVNQNSEGFVQVGTTTKAVTGAVVVNDTDAINGNTSFISVNGGTTVNVNSTYTFDAAHTRGGGIYVGTTSNSGSLAVVAPTGAVTIVVNATGYKALSGDLGSIFVNGGTTVSVTENATQPINAATTAGATNDTIRQGSVTVHGSTTTTSVTVNQTAAATAAISRLATAGVNEVDNVVFSALGATGTATVGGLTFTATAAMTATQVAAAFANLTAGANQGNSTLGTYTGTFSPSWNGGAVIGTSSNTVAFTDTTAATSGGSAALAVAGPTATIATAGVTAVTAIAGVGGVTDGAVDVTDANYGTATAGTITSVTENGYATGYIHSDALATLSLANSTGQTVTVNDHTAKTLSLTVNNLGAASALNLDGAGATYTTLNVTTAGADSVLSVTGTVVTALNVSGSNAIDLTGSNFSGLKTATVSGAAGVTVDVSTDASFTDFNASGTSGNNTVTVDATKATFEGGSGVDTVTLSAANPTKAVSLGAGNDSLTLAAGTTAPTATLDGGTGTNTLSMAAADAVTASGTTTFATKVINFQDLTLTGGTGAQTVDVAKLGNYMYVTDAATAADSLTALNLASGGTLVLTDTAFASQDTVDLSTASAASNSLNIVLSAAGATNAGDAVTTTANANVTSVNINANDTTASVVAGTNTDALTLTDAAATSIKVTGNANLHLTSANTSVTSVDASGMSGGLIYTTAGTTAETVKGGASANTLTAATGTQADTLIGGAGNDTITANAGLDTLTGGGGNDTFVITTPSANVNSYATITDAHIGDTIKMVALGTDVFAQSKVTLANTAVFQDYANAAVNANGNSSVNGHISWFQYGGDTYIVESVHNALTTPNFQNGTDIIVKLTGAVDLSHTSLNTQGATLLIG
jgi:S-layer protein